MLRLFYCIASSLFNWEVEVYGVVVKAYVISLSNCESIASIAPVYDAKDINQWRSRTKSYICTSSISSRRVDQTIRQRGCVLRFGWVVIHQGTCC